MRLLCPAAQKRGGCSLILPQNGTFSPSLNIEANKDCKQFNSMKLYNVYKGIIFALYNFFLDLILIILDNKNDY